MHRLKEITIRNFRSIKDQDFTLSDYTALIGYNNAGKTNLLLACKWLLRKWSLSESDFHNRELSVEVEGIVGGITEEILGRLPAHQAEATRPFILDETLIIKRVQTEPGQGIRDIKFFVKKINPEPGEDPWNPAPTGLDPAMTVLFPEPIFIGAIENIEEDVTKNKTTTTIGRLISEIIAPIEEEYGGKAREAMDVLRKALDADGEERADRMKAFDAQANEKINVLFPGVSIRLHVEPPELKDFFKSGTIKVYEDGQDGGRDISSFGSGAQRSIQMALIRQLAEVKKGLDANPSRTLLLIDEPELYLHPQAIEQVRVALKQLSQEGYQVIFATHSAQMVKSADVSTSLLIRKSLERGTHRRKRVEDAINEILAGDHESQLELMFTLSNSNQILFAESVLLIEGKTESKVLPKIFEVITQGETLEMIKCALVKQDGGSNTWKSMKILNAMDVPTKAIVDLDYAFNQGFLDRSIAEDDSDVMACKAIFLTMYNAGEIEITSEGLPKKSKEAGKKNKDEAFYDMAMSDAGQIHIQNLHNKLKAQNIWLWRRGSIEAHLGLQGKTEQIWARFVKKLTDSDDVHHSIPDFEEVQRLVAWIKG
jgi:predicted ATP-dependent endonuclease of OLD family